MEQTAEEVFKKGEKIIHILLKAGFAIKQNKVKRTAQEYQFLEVKYHQIPMDMVKKIAAISPPTS